MTKKINKNYTMVEKNLGQVIFSKEVEYEKELLELNIKINSENEERIVYKYQPVIQET